MERWSASSFGPIPMGEKGRTLGKTYGIKARCYWEHLWGTHWEPRKISGTHWKLEGNLLGRKNEKNPSLTPPKT